MVLTALFSLHVHAQKKVTLGEIDMGLLMGYHTLLTNPSYFVLGEEYELGGYLIDIDNGGMLAITTSYLRNGAYGTYYLIPPVPGQNTYAIGQFTTAKIKGGKLWELNAFDVLATVGFGWINGADFGDKTGAYGLLYIDPEVKVNTFSMPISIDLQWYGFDGSMNSVGLKYDINGWNNFWGVGFTYLL